jgi:group I intron endonuclease
MDSFLKLTINCISVLQLIYLLALINIFNGFQSNILLQRAINKYNLQNFIFVIFEYCETEELISREQFYLDALKPEYNILKVAGSSLGYVHTKESKVKIGETHKGKTGVNSPNFGKIISAETKAKMSVAKIGKNHPMFDKTHSVKTKMSLALSGENHPMYNKIILKKIKIKLVSVMVLLSLYI